jgi:hypothetical protein
MIHYMSLEDQLNDPLKFLRVIYLKSRADCASTFRVALPCQQFLKNARSIPDDLTFWSSIPPCNYITVELLYVTVLHSKVKI